MNPLRAGRLWAAGLVVGLSLVAAVAYGIGAVLGGFVLGAVVGWANLEGIAWLVRRAFGGGGSGHRGLVLLLLPVKLVLVVLVAMFALRLLGLSLGAFAVGVATALLAAVLGDRTGAAAGGRDA